MRRWSICFWIMAAMSFLCGYSTVRGKEMRIVENGKSDYVIFVAEDPAAPEQFAAEELQDYLKRISGCRLPIQRGGTPPEKAILIGGACRHAGVDITKEGLEDALHTKVTNEAGEGFIIRTKGDTLIIAGIIPRATLYAAYELLELLGCRFFTPDKDDEVIPQSKSLTIPAMDLKDRAEAASPVRQVQLVAIGRATLPHYLATINWAPKLRLNHILIPPGPRLHLCEYEAVRDQVLPQVQKRSLIINFSEHVMPFYFAYDKFKAAGAENHVALRARGEWHMPCFSDENDMETLIRNTLLFLKDHPETGVLGLMPSNGSPWCECEACQKPTSGDVFLRGCNRIEQAVARQYPHVIIEPLAGYHLSSQVRETKPNAKLRFLWQGWKELYEHCRGGVEWNYAGKTTFIPRLGAVATSGRKAKKNGVFVGLNFYFSRSAWWSESFFFYSGAKRHWNKTLTESDLLDDYIKMYFPQSGEVMRRYILGFQTNEKIDHGICSPDSKAKTMVFADSEACAREALEMVRAGKIQDEHEAERIEKAHMLVRLLNGRRRLNALARTLDKLAAAHDKGALSPEGASRARGTVKEIVPVYNKYQDLLGKCAREDGVYPLDFKGALGRTGDLKDKGFSVSRVLVSWQELGGSINRKHTLSFLNSLSADETLWWEAEDAAVKNLGRDFQYSPKNDEEKAKLSGGVWIGADGVREGPALFAEYQVSVPKTRRYYLWARKFYTHGAFRWRFEEQPWHNSPANRAFLEDSVQVREHLEANWAYLGMATLAEGKHSFRFELLANEGESATSAFDCFVLTGGAFTPRGIKKPEEWKNTPLPGSRSEADEPESWHLPTQF